MWEISKAKHFIEKYEVILEFLEGWKGSTQKTFIGRAYNFQTTCNINNFSQRNTIQFQHPFQLVQDSSLLMVKVSKNVPENENCSKIEMSNIK